jgi:hypothetical protein
MGSEAEDVILRIAAQQHGAVDRQQLLEAGISADTLDRRIRKLRLRPIFRGVYLVGPVVASCAREMAALLACGQHAVVSHVSAARLWQIMLPGTGRAAVDVTVPHNDHVRRAGIRAHRSRTMSPGDVTNLAGIRLTTPARTLLDLACLTGSGQLTTRQLERALAEALARKLIGNIDLVSLLKQNPRRRGARRLRAILEAGDPALTRSEAEERFLALVRRARLPEPEANVMVSGTPTAERRDVKGRQRADGRQAAGGRQALVGRQAAGGLPPVVGHQPHSMGGYVVDFFWRAQRFVVEIDGYAFHSSREMFEADRKRDAVLAAAGLRFIRVTWRQIVDEPEAMLVRLGQALAHTPLPDH